MGEGGEKATTEPLSFLCEEGGGGDDRIKPI